MDVVMQLKQSNEYTTEVMDHHGLVAATCRDLGIAEKINERIGSKDPRRKIQPGLATVAMIINGLGFSNRRLYLTPQFFESKAVNFLFEESVKASDFSDHTLGKCLDEIAAYGTTKLFGEVAFDIAHEQCLLGTTAHLDSTSFSLEGEYNSEDSEQIINVTHGFSKDNRPDLKQVMLSLVMTGDANLPIWMEPLSGNSSDKSSFHETIANVKKFQKELKSSTEFLWVADSALYTGKKLLSCPDVLWLTRVPENIKACSKLISMPDESFCWTESAGGYKWVEVCNQYSEIKQRWLLVFSQQAYEREKKTLKKRIEKEKSAFEKACWHLGNQIFGCPTDAEKQIILLNKKYQYHMAVYAVEPIEKYAGSGRPNPKTPKIIQGYRLNISVTEDQKEIDRTLTRKGRFILATNQLDDNELPAEKILQQYKEQQSVEGGFRFLKDPWFMLDSFFIKTPHRIEALMMVMTLCLLVYNFAQHRIRKTLKENNDTVPNQLGREINNPTVRWLFQCMEGIAIIVNSLQAMITNVNDLRCKIIRLFGATACQIYGIEPEIAGM